MMIRTYGRALCVALVLLTAAAGLAAALSGGGEQNITEIGCYTWVNPNGTGWVKITGTTGTDPNDPTCKRGRLEFDPSRCAQNACRQAFGTVWYPTGEYW